MRRRRNDRAMALRFIALCAMATLPLRAGPPLPTARPEAAHHGQIPKFEYVLLCDDIRQEVGDKQTLVGIYDYHIVVPSLPFVLPKVCFYARFSNMDGEYQFSCTVVDPQGVRKEVVAPSKAVIPPGAREGKFNVIASPFDVKAAGIYSAFFRLAKGAEQWDYQLKFAISLKTP